MNILTFTTLFPNAVVPHHGIFVERRLLHLLRHSSVKSTVFAPVPWFPFRNRLFGEYASYAAVPARENRSGMDVYHPRYPLIPKVGMSVAPMLLALSIFTKLKRHRSDVQDFDIIDAHYFYPDGVAAVLLGKWLKKPVVITARGTDINLIPKYALPRMWILWAASRCAKIITVSDALRNRILELGVDADKVRTLRNGVDLGFFRPESDRSVLRKELQIRGFTLLSVGHLIESKGHHLVIRSLHDLANVSLVIIGSGRMRGELESLASETGVADRVRFAGAVSPDELRRYYNAADALVLASSREGMPNALLESIACWTPVVATPYGGSPEVITNHHAGQLTENRSPDAIAEGVDALRKSYPDRADTRRHAEKFSWQATTEGQIELFSRICGVGA